MPKSTKKLPKRKRLLFLDENEFCFYKKKKGLIESVPKLSDFLEMD